MNKKISNKNLVKEEKIQEQINKNLDDFESFCFDAGAGAGKTYALQKSIEHILRKNKRLRDRRQKILCITYTNAAKNEIVCRMGRNSEVVISTIHDFLWNFISAQQILLIEQHNKLLKNELLKIEASKKEFLNNNFLDKNIFEEKVSGKQFLHIFNEKYSENAKVFADAIKSYDIYFDNCLSNINKFKKTVRNTNRAREYKRALESNCSNNKVRYNPVQNRDNLAKYVISHDTLLNYCKNIIEENAILKRLFLDKYPYVLIDEYQDTDERVVDIISSIKEYASSRNKSFIVGYFGDTLQNIYENGVGTLLNKDQYKVINKQFNRRSTSQIISVIEKIRNDGFGQKSIYENNDDGQCTFYISNMDFDLKSFLKSHNLNTGTACLFLKNKDIAEKRNFGNLLKVISNFPKFKGSNYGNINNEFLQKNVQHIGWLLREVLTFVDFVEKITDNSTTVKAIINFAPELMKRTTFGDFEKFVRNVRQKLTNFEAMTLEECIESIVDVDGNICGNKVIRNIFSIENKNCNVIRAIKNSAFEYLCFSENENSESIDSFFEIKFIQFENWYKYVFDNKNINTELSYYTLHGSKGLEFNNVVVVLQDKFARRKNYCRYFFDNYNNSKLNSKDKKRFNEVRNLLYVACSRAKKNLYVVYEVSNYKELLSKNSKTYKNITAIFPEVEFINEDIEN